MKTSTLLSELVDTTVSGGTVANMYKSNLTDNQRRAIWEVLLTKRRSNDQNKLLPGAAREVSLKFNISPTTIRDIFKRGQESLAVGNVVVDVSGQKCGRVGRKKRLLDLEAVKAIPLMQRQNIRSLAGYKHAWGTP